MSTWDCIVIGCGGIGSAALYQLARRGCKVLGIDQYRPPHNHGSSHGETRMIRKAYFESPDYVPMVQEAYRLWHELEEVTGQQLLHSCGLLEIGPPNGILLRGVRAAAQQHDLLLQEIPAAEFGEAFPQLQLPEGYQVVFEPDAGYLLVEQCIEQHLSMAMRLGADVQLDVGAVDWRKVGPEIHVATANNEFVTKKLVLTVGAWSSNFLKLSAPMQILHKTLHWYQENNGLMPKDLPAFFYETDKGQFYGLPSQENNLFKVARHDGGIPLPRPPADLSSVRDPTDEESVEEFVGSYISKEWTKTKSQNCMYTMTADQHFVLDRHPTYEDVTVAAGFSGHGFKFAPSLGQSIAQLALDEPPSLDIGFLSATRPALGQA